MLTAFALVIALVIILVARGWVKVVKQRAAAHGFLVLAGRWLAGHPWHGKPLTDAGWSRAGTRALTPTGHASRFWYRPQKHRMARRSGTALVTVTVLLGLLFDFWPTVAVLSAAVIAAAAYGTFAAVRWQRQRKHVKTWLYPAHLNAAPLAGHPVAMDPADWLVIEPDRSRVTAELPPAYNGDDKARQRLVETLTGKLGIEAPEVRWQLAGPRPRLELTQSKPPPAKVFLADVRAAIEAAKADEIVWGIGKKNRPVKTSFGGDSPHVGLSMGSGAGKSELAKVVLTQLLFHGAIGLILDHKMTSHPWAKGLPNVVTAVRIPEIHKALVWLGGHEVPRRKEVSYAGTDVHGNVHADVGPRIIVIAEELNATVAQLRTYWRELGEKSRSPALTALDEVSFTGRSVLINLVYIGQRLSDKATGGGGDARENIGVIAFARYRPSTWKMLAPDHAMPAKSNAPGRLQVVSDQVQETQAPLFTTGEARELALSGVVSPLPYGMPGAPRATGDSHDAEIAVYAPEQGSATVSGAVEPLAVSGGVTLSEAHEAGVFGRLTLAGLRTARHRDETFPAHTGRRGLALEYDPAALAVWARQRVS